MTCLDRLRDLLRREPWWTELWSGVAAIMWAKWVYWQPMDLAEREPYRIVSFLASDATWEWIAFIGGFAQVVVVCLDLRWGRFGMATLASAFWLVLAYGLWMQNTSAPGAALYMMQGVANMASLMLISLRRHD